VDALDLARLQFGVVTVYHFFFVPLTLGLSVLIAIIQTMWHVTGDETYKRMTKFWGKLFVINFAMGVVTGIVQEFQFGMNWSEYSRFMGDIFGAPLAIEALLAFYLESTFIGVWMFGWDKLPKKVHLASVWLVAIGSNLSALWILIANSFMQEPLGYAIDPKTGYVKMDDFLKVATNPNVILQWPHVFTSAMTTAAFFVLGISAWHLLRKTKERDFFLKSARVAAIYGVVGIIFVVLVGHLQAQHMVKTQPMKMAAAEALYESEDPASFSLFAFGENSYLKIPRMLSLLAYNKLDGEVKGINDLQKEYAHTYRPRDKRGVPIDYSPPVMTTYWSFRIMVGAGLLMLAMALYAAYLFWKGTFAQATTFLKWLPWAIFLPYIANSTGWIMTEIGRQPWIVFGLLRTDQAVSPNVSAGMVAASLITFTLLYTVLMFADIYLLKKYSVLGPEGLEGNAPQATAQAAA